MLFTRSGRRDLNMIEQEEVIWTRTMRVKAILTRHLSPPIVERQWMHETAKVAASANDENQWKWPARTSFAILEAQCPLVPVFEMVQSLSWRSSASSGIQLAPKAVLYSSSGSKEASEERDSAWELWTLEISALAGQRKLYEDDEGGDKAATVRQIWRRGLQRHISSVHILARPGIWTQEHGLALSCTTHRSTCKEWSARDRWRQP